MHAPWQRDVRLTLQPTYTTHMNGCIRILRQRTHTQTQLSSEPQASYRVSGRRHEVVAMGTSRKAEFITDITRPPKENQASDDQAEQCYRLLKRRKLSEYLHKYRHIL